MASVPSPEMFYRSANTRIHKAVLTVGNRTSASQHCKPQTIEELTMNGVASDSNRRHFRYSRSFVVRYWKVYSYIYRTVLILYPGRNEDRSGIHRTPPGPADPPGVRSATFVQSRLCAHMAAPLITACWNIKMVTIP
jgi:hypothetical protein